MRFRSVCFLPDIRKKRSKPICVRFFRLSLQGTQNQPSIFKNQSKKLPTWPAPVDSFYCNYSEKRGCPAYRPMVALLTFVCFKSCTNGVAAGVCIVRTYFNFGSAAVICLVMVFTICDIAFDTVMHLQHSFHYIVWEKSEKICEGIMAVYAIADLHLSFGTDKPMDVFFGWNDYVQKLQTNWEKLVGAQDTVVIPGDISWGINYAEALPDLQWLDALPGKKLLLKGNHDLWWDTMNKNARLKESAQLESIDFVFNNAYPCQNIAVCGTRSWFFDAEKSADKKVLLREVGRLQRSVDAAKQTGKEPVVFLHYPPLSLLEECEEILDCLVQNGIKRCYYGHMHGKAAQSAFEGEKYGIQFHLIAADRLEFCPYLIEK